MTNSKKKKIIPGRLDWDVWEKLEKAKEQYKIDFEDMPKKNINTIFINRAVDLYCSDNSFEQICELIGLEPKEIKISNWIRKNWNKITINKTISDTEYSLKLDSQIDFDALIKVWRDSEGEIYKIDLLSDNSSYKSCKLVWDIEDIWMLSDYLN